MSRKCSDGLWVKKSLDFIYIESSDEEINGAKVEFDHILE